jgi:hypothetical protein
VAYDAAVVTVSATLAVHLIAQRKGTQIELSWSGGTPVYTVETCHSLSTTNWQSVVVTNGSAAAFPIIQEAQFFRIRSQ